MQQYQDQDYRFCTLNPSQDLCMRRWCHILSSEQEIFGHLQNIVRGKMTITTKEPTEVLLAASQNKSKTLGSAN
ncbi:hypothetical protein XELAEV_18046479mg [Xenopus laevis]|uniref:Uncharacterized protein n=1 Tax=Xenopus laevis TaxID=8355 RepID=A0A974H0M8_XENLA|nr:hypothetical protein XELAEV_18046479mg [Xenopus laevis]